MSVRRLSLAVAGLLAAALLVWLTSRGGDSTTQEDTTHATETAKGTPHLVGLPGASRATADAAPAHAPAKADADAGAIRRDLRIEVRGPQGRIAGARVIVRTMQGAVLFEDTSDANGTLPLGFGAHDEVQVEVRAPGYRVYLTSHRRFVADADSAHNALDIELEPGVPFEGRVEDAVTGTAIAGARVSVDDWGDKDAGLTDEQGRFAYPGIANEEESTVRAEAPGYAVGKVDVVVRGGAITPRPPVVVKLHRGGRLTGRVLDPDGQPMRDAVVRLWRYYEEHVGTLPTDKDELRELYGFGDDLHTHDYDRGGFEVRTSEDGTFAFESLSLDTNYRAQAFSEGLARSASLSGIRVSAQQRVRTATLRLRRPGRARVTVLGPDGEPVRKKVRARLFLARDMYKPSVERPPDYSFDGLPAGRLHVFAQAEGFQPVLAEVRVDAGDTATIEVRLERGATIEGVVVDESGTPIAGAEVEAALALDNQSFDGDTDFLLSEQEARTDAQGRFTLRGLRPGPSVLLARAERGEQTLRTPDRVRCVAPSRGLRVRLVPLGRLKARLIAADGTPYRGETWCHWPAGGAAWNLDDGRIHTWGMKRGKKTFVFSPTDHAFLVREAVIEIGKTTDLGDLRLTRGVTLAGRVVGPDGRPVEGVRVRCIDCPPRVTVSDAQGRFSIAHMPEGPHEYSIEADGYVEMNLDLTAAREGVEIVLKRAVQIRGQVRPAAGALPPDSWIEFVPRHGKPRPIRYYDADGKLQEYTSIWGSETFDLDEAGRFVGSLAPDEYVVTWVLSGREAPLGTHTVVQGDNAPFAFEIPEQK